MKLILIKTSGAATRTRSSKRGKSLVTTAFCALFSLALAGNVWGEDGDQGTSQETEGEEPSALTSNEWVANNEIAGSPFDNNFLVDGNSVDLAPITNILKIVGTDVKGFFYGYTAKDFTKPFGAFVDIAAGKTLTITNGVPDAIQTLSGPWSGSGNLVFAEDNDAAKSQAYVFLGPMTNFYGNITRPVVSGTPSFATDLTNATGIIQFGSTDYVGAGLVTRPESGSVSGNGEISTAGLLRYEYAAVEDSTLSVTNSSITAKLLDFTGGADYMVSSALTGNGETAADNVLRIRQSKVTLDGASASNFGELIVTDGSQLVMSSGSYAFTNATITTASSINVTSNATFKAENLTLNGINCSGSIYVGDPGYTDVEGVNKQNDIVTGTTVVTNGARLLVKYETEVDVEGLGLGNLQIAKGSVLEVRASDKRTGLNFSGSTIDGALFFNAVTNKNVVYTLDAGQTLNGTELYVGGGAILQNAGKLDLVNVAIDDHPNWTDNDVKGILHVVNNGEVTISSTDDRHSAIYAQIVVDAGATLTLTNTIDFVDTISNTGTVHFAEGVVIDLGGIDHLFEGQKRVYQLVKNEGDGKITGFANLKKRPLRSFKFQGDYLSSRETVWVKAANSETEVKLSDVSNPESFVWDGAIIVEGNVGDLVWKNADALWRTNNTVEAWLDSVNAENMFFMNADNVNFTNENATVKLGSTVSAKHMTVYEDTTLDLAGYDFNAYTIAVANGKTLTITNSASSKPSYLTGDITVTNRVVETETINEVSCAVWNDGSWNHKVFGDIASGKTIGGGKVVICPDTGSGITNICFAGSANVVVAKDQNIEISNVTLSESPSATLSVLGNATISTLVLSNRGTLNVFGNVSIANMTMSGGTLNVTAPGELTLANGTRNGGSTTGNGKVNIANGTVELKNDNVTSQISDPLHVVVKDKGILKVSAYSALRYVELEIEEGGELRLQNIHTLYYVKAKISNKANIKYGEKEAYYFFYNSVDGFRDLRCFDVSEVIYFSESFKYYDYKCTESFAWQDLKVRINSYYITDYVTKTWDENTGKINIELNAKKINPNVTSMKMPYGEYNIFDMYDENSYYPENITGDWIQFTIDNPKPGFYYSVVSSDSPDFKTTGSSNGVFAKSTNEPITLRIVMPADRVKYFKIRVQLTHRESDCTDPRPSSRPTGGSQDGDDNDG